MFLAPPSRWVNGGLAVGASNNTLRDHLCLALHAWQAAEVGGQCAMAPVQRMGSCLPRRVQWGLCKSLLTAYPCSLHHLVTVFPSLCHMHSATMLLTEPRGRGSRRCAQASPSQKSKEEEAMGLGHWGGTRSRCVSLISSATALSFPTERASATHNCLFHCVTAFGTSFSWLI